MDVWLVFGRLLRIGLNICDQMPPGDLEQLLKDLPYTYAMRALLARPWEDLTPDLLDSARDALVNVIPACPSATVSERAGGDLALDSILEILLHGCRSTSMIQCGGYLCSGCQKRSVEQFYFRVNNFDFEADSDKSRTWSRWANLRFQPRPMRDWGLAAKQCDVCGTSLEYLDYVLDRLPPYLIYSWGFDQLPRKFLKGMYLDLDVTHMKPTEHRVRSNT